MLSGSVQWDSAKPTKVCTKCHTVKAVAEFSVCPHTKTGLQSWCKKCTNVYNIKWARSTPERRARSNAAMRRSHLKRSYGLTVADCQEMYVACGGICACCGRPMVSGGRRSESAVIDHDHVTGETRGLIHSRCNLGLGKLGDSIAGLTRALAYLKAVRGVER